MALAKQTARFASVVISLVMLGNPTAVFAQRKPSDALFAARTLKCWFSADAAGEWKGKRITVEKGGPPYKEPLIYDSIDVVKGTARSIGNIGGGDVRVVANGAGLTFIEVASANVAIMTVFASLAGPSEYHAVLSHHIKLPTGPYPSQAYGTCLLMPN